MDLARARHLVEALVNSSAVSPGVSGRRTVRRRAAHLFNLELPVGDQRGPRASPVYPSQPCALVPWGSVRVISCGFHAVRCLRAVKLLLPLFPCMSASPWDSKASQSTGDGQPNTVGGPERSTAKGGRMAIYRATWRVTGFGLLGVGLVLALLAWPLGAAAAVFAIGFVMGASVVLLMRELQVEATQAARTAPAGFATGLILVASGGLSTMLDMMILPVLVVVGLSSPRLVTYLWRRLSTKALHGSRRTHGNPATSVGSTTHAASLTDAALCAAWNATCRELRRSPSASVDLGIVQARQAYLDEMERRNPHGLLAWMASGASATGNLAPYVLRRGQAAP